ncbi:MAG: acyl-CoA dehydrogenase family protein [Alphaproteobacteria bacterium]|jgi:alkylation response protein AidB-like acyl-CoA dehydrogenase|nr:acyl-CoA dehydrogenase family protein [Alphaproteobacteria bacterium]MDP6567006.1 acyl-CoA dehydrogenase family protein [Alphaproteobacteria bacterium]MDP6812185.1 acyl-CoA dehydrogenase family protein [Alphaproteobacteria bacterium]
MEDPNLTFDFTDEQKLLRESVLGTLQRVLPPEKIRELDKAGEYPYEACAALAEAGINGIVYPEEYGGQDGSFTDLAVLGEALGYHYGGIAQAWGITCIYAGMHIALHGSDEMKREVLPKVISGDMRMALCLSEPDHGSDVASIETLAVRDGGGYVLNGQKIYNSAAHVAHNLVVVCKTKPGRGYDGISMFLVDTTLPGVTVQRLDALGRHTTEANHCFFEDVHLPADRLIGTENDGWAGLMKCLNVERLNLAANGVGNTLKIMEHALAYAKERQQFGRPIGKFQAVSHKFAEMQIMYQTARAQTFRVARMLDAGADPIMENAVAKAYTTEVNWKVADMAMQILAGAGYILDQDMQMMFRDARVGPIGGGTSEIQRNVIAQRMGL